MTEQNRSNTVEISDDLKASLDRLARAIRHGANTPHRIAPVYGTGP